MDADDITDLTEEWIYAQRDEEPHKGGWLVGDCWVDRHSYADHARECPECRANAVKEMPHNG